MSQLSHAQFPLRRHPNLLVDHRRSRSAAVAEPRGANGEAVTGSGGRLHFGMVAGIKSERWPTSNRNPRPDCLGIRKLGRRRLQLSERLSQTRKFCRLERDGLNAKIRVSEEGPRRCSDLHQVTRVPSQRVLKLA